MKPRRNPLYAATAKGYEARERGEPFAPPYKGTAGINFARNQAWSEGWKCADAELTKLRS